MEPKIKDMVDPRIQQLKVGALSLAAGLHHGTGATAEKVIEESKKFMEYLNQP